VRRRLLVTYLTLLTAVVAGLSLPLAAAVAVRDTQTMFIDRQGDTARFASLAEPALRTGRTRLLAAELARYHDMHGIAAMVVGRDGRPVVASRDGVVVTAAVREHIEAGLSGARAAGTGVSWPWQADPLIVAEPVRGNGEIIGVAVTVSPTGPLHGAIRRNWILLAVAGAVVLLVGAGTAAPLSAWMLRPVRRLDDAAHALAAGRFGDRIATASGPPELRRLVESFNAMSERVAMLVQRQRSFSSYASHQLRTPLATLRLCVENLRPSLAPDGDAEYRLVVSEIERMGRMCDALLTYAQAEATADEATEADAAGVADGRVAIWGRAAGQAGLRLRRTGPARAPVRAAPQALDQALDALLSNAVKFAGAGAEVEVRVEPVGGAALAGSAGVAGAGWVDIHVVDSGPGLPPEDLTRAVEAFWRRTGEQNVEGWGLGITIADALVTASGGRLELMSAQPYGLHARIRLPAAGAR
jgi:signal transduction histidine kinase